MKLALALVLAAACGDNSAPPCRDGVCGGFLRDGDGRAWIVRGANLAGAHKNAPYTDTFTPADYQRLHDAWGMTGVRFLITWSAIEPVRGQFDDSYLDWVAERMDWADAAGLAVVLDMHQDIYGEGFGFDGAPSWSCDAVNYAGFVPMQPWGINYADSHVMACFDHLWTDAGTQAELVAAWQHVGERLADRPAVVGFDPINEPSWGSYAISTFERDRLQPFYDQVIAAVHGAAPKWTAFVEPSNSRSLGFSTSLRHFDGAGVVYAPHLYDVNAEQTGRFDPSRAQMLVDEVGDFATEAETLGGGLWIGEYGGQGTDPEIAAYMGADYDAAAAFAAGTMTWAYDEGGGYSLLDANGAEVAPLVAAIVRPAPARVAGTPGAYSFDPASRVFTLALLPDSSISAPTEIMVPPRLYPAGFSVDCGGCEHALAADGVTLQLSHLTATTVAIAP